MRVNFMGTFFKPGKRVAAALFLFALPTGIFADDSPEGSGSCRFSPEEQVIVTLLKEHEGQRRKVLVCDPRLQEFATSRARDMAERDYFGHLTPERNGPNELLRDTGYPLPEYYVDGIANSVESILAGESDPATAWRLLLDSTPHRKHLLGQNTMYMKQEQFGVAYVHQPDSDYAHYWVIVIVESGKSERPMTCTPSPPVCFVH